MDRSQDRLVDPQVRQNSPPLLHRAVALGQRNSLVHRLTGERVREPVPFRPCALDQLRRSKLVEGLRDRSTVSELQRGGPAVGRLLRGTLATD